MLKNIPTPENIAGGLRPNLSDMKAIRIVVTTRVSPMKTADSKGSIDTPASLENWTAYTNTTKIPENCWNVKNVIMIPSGLYSSGFLSCLHFEIFFPSTIEFERFSTSAFISMSIRLSLISVGKIVNQYKLSKHEAL